MEIPQVNVRADKRMPKLVGHLKAVRYRTNTITTMV